MRNLALLRASADEADWGGRAGLLSDARGGPHPLMMYIYKCQPEIGCKHIWKSVDLVLTTSGEIANASCTEFP